MFDQSELRDELQALKGDLSRLLNTTGEGIFDASKNRAEALAEQIKVVLDDLGQTFERAGRQSRKHHHGAADRIARFRLRARRRCRPRAEEALK